ncbi:hydroquinone glucosyltransferase [Vigna unguiculata]|uniref:Glycosyltransferase n=1 Tax=Vigna unguiculata TaxID=3917 RepID=A0A4D6M1M9_VIGUN|nr:hydroquinone glucosyltransferase [Vigna unguiculata]
MKDTIVLYPNIGRGHLVSMVELGKLILSHHPSLSITILILTPSPNATFTQACNSNAQYIAAVSATIPAITFHSVPMAQLPPDTPSVPPHLISLELSRHSTQNVAFALQSLAKASNIKALVMDFLNFSNPKTLTQNLTTNFPTFFYYTSAASSLVVLFHLPTTLPKQIQDQQFQLHFPGLPAISMDIFPNESLDPLSYINQIFGRIAEAMKGSSGIIINTYEAMEEKAIAVLNDDGILPPLFCVGPVISAPYGEEDKGCLSWLESQPSQSVVLLCFGSMGWFSRRQLMEMAIGLEKSEQRFLWVVRTELEDGNSVEEKPSLDELLPEGFLDRTKEKGLVVRDWAPQREILSHDSVGGFVTHCGWNSVLEAVCEGVPMVAWPLYAEQKLNRVLMVEEMKVALALKEEKDGLVSGSELGERVRELMESDTGKEIRQRVFKMKLSAAEALVEGGTSRVALDRLAAFCKTSSFTI